jgi:hypothetical protein
MGAPRKYTLNENYFESVDNETKAYWLGFIYADGFITKRKPGHGQNVLGITLAEKDHVERFCESIGTNKPVKTYKKIRGYSEESVEHKIALISNKLVSDIEKLGVVENKTFLLESIPKIPEEYVRDFIRGYFDGDGSVYSHIQKSNRQTKKGIKEYSTTQLGVGICGTKKFLTSLISQFKFLSIDNKCLYEEKRRDTDTWAIRFGSTKRCLALYDYLYGHNPTDYMPRKKKIFERSLIKTEI